MKIVIIGDAENSLLGSLIRKKKCSCINVAWDRWDIMIDRINDDDIVIVFAYPFFIKKDHLMASEEIAGNVAACIQILQLNASVCLIAPPCEMSYNILTPSQIIRIPAIANRSIILNFFFTGILYKIHYNNGNEKYSVNVNELIPEKVSQAIFDTWNDLLKLPIQPSLFND